MHRLKTLHIGDSADLAALHKKCFDKAWSQESFEDMLQNIAICNVGVYQEDRLLGAIIYIITLDEAEIYSIFVDPDHQRKNIASYLLDNMRQNCSDSLVVKIFLEVEHSNKKAIHLYEKHGYKAINIRKNYYPSGQNAIIYEYIL